jgi:hypothetical protein
VISLTRTVWIAFRRGRGLLFLVFSLLLLGMMTSAVLGFEGILSVNGRAAPISDAMRIDFALGIGLRWINLFGMLIVLLVGPGLVLGEVERGPAVFDLTAPVSRVGYLIGRSLGLVLILLLFWVASIGVLGGVLAWHEGIVRGTLVAGIPIFILGQLLLLGILLLFRMIVGGGWGAVVGVLIWVGSWLFSLDMLEGYLFDVNVPAEKAVWWMPLLGPYLEGEPIGPSATAARVLVRLFPPAGNVESVALDVALGKAVFPRSDWWSLPVAVVWMLLACLGVVALFRRKDL